MKPCLEKFNTLCSSRRHPEQLFCKLHIVMFTLTPSSGGLRGQELRRGGGGWKERNQPLGSFSTIAPVPHLLQKKTFFFHSCSNQENMHSFLTDWIMRRFEKIVQFALFSVHPQMLRVQGQLASTHNRSFIFLNRRVGPGSNSSTY